MRTLKKALSLVLVLAMVFALAVPGFAADTTKKAADFKDYSKVTNKEAVDVMTAIGVINGNADGTFNPEGSFTRAEAATMITYLTLGKTVANALPTGATQFTDVPATHWAAKYIQYCAQEGIVNGIGGGKFDPDAKLTATQWALMLLGALGYKASNEGIGGTGWEIATTKLAMQAGIATADELTGTFNRDMAAKMAFNTLTATTVEYQGGSTVTVNGVTFTNGATRKDVSDKNYKGNKVSGDYKNYNGEALDGSLQFCEAHFPGLTTKVAATTGSFLRPSVEWKYVDGKTTTTVKSVATAKAVYTTAVTGKTIYNDLGLSEEATVTFAKNGTADQKVAEAAFKVNATNTNTVGGNGVVTEVYKTGDTALKIVQIQYTLGYVNNVVDYKATSAKGAYTSYAVNGVAESGKVYEGTGSALVSGGKVYSSVVNKTEDKDSVKIEGTVAKGDYVLVVKDASASDFAYIYPVKTVTGALTASSATTYTIDGTAYTKAAVTDTIKFDKDLYGKTNSVTFVLDSYGNVVAPVKAAETAKNYVYVAFAEKAYSLTGTTLNPSITAYVVGTDGKISTMSVTKVGDEAVKQDTAATALANGLYTYKLAKNGTTYEFTTASNALSSATLDYKDNAKITDDVKGNANTVFYTIKIDNEKDSATKGQPVAVTTTTGMANLSKVTDVKGAYIANSNGVAEYVFIESSKATTTASVVYYYGEFSFDGSTEYTYTVLKNGEKTTIKGSATLFTDNKEGLYVIKDDGTAELKNTAKDFTEGTGAWIADGKTYGINNNGGLLTVTETDVKSAETKDTKNFATVADSVPVYTISAEANSVTAGTAADLNVAGASLIYIAATADKTIGAIYVVVA